MIIRAPTASASASAGDSREARKGAWRPPSLFPPLFLVALTSGQCPDDQKRLGPSRNSFGQQSVGALVGDVLPTGKEPYEGAALLRDVIAHRPPQHRIAGLQSAEDRPLRDGALHLDRHLAIKLGERPQMGR